MVICTLNGHIAMGRFKEKNTVCSLRLINGQNLGRRIEGVLCRFLRKIGRECLSDKLLIVDNKNVVNLQLQVVPKNCCFWFCSGLYLKVLLKPKSECSKCSEVI